MSTTTNQTATGTNKQSTSAFLQNIFGQRPVYSAASPVASTPAEDAFAGLQLDNEQNQHTSGELGNSAAINNAFDLKDYSSSAIWVVGALFAIYFGLRLIRNII